MATYGADMAKHGVSEKRLVTLGKQLIRNRIIQTQAVFASKPKKEWTGEEEQRLRKLAKRRRTASGMSDDDTQLVSCTLLHFEETSNNKYKSWLAWVHACRAVLCHALPCRAIPSCAVLCCAINSNDSIHCMTPAEDLKQNLYHLAHVHTFTGCIISRP